MPSLYRNESSDPKYNAQRNLSGWTHYVDDATLRFHKSRILETKITDNGLLFALVESYAADPDNHKRLFRPVIFDVFGSVIDRVKLQEGFASHKAATKAMWDRLNGIDAKQITLDAIANTEHWHDQEMMELKTKIKTFQNEKEEGLR